MIEKLKVYEETSSGYKHPENIIQDKINELIDTVNELHEEAESYARTRAYHEKLIDTLVAENNIHERQIDELQIKVNKLAPNINFAQPEVKENVQDKFAEQRKWIGKFCKFWDNDDGETESCGLLDEINEDNFHPFASYLCGNWKHCEPVKPDDDIIYKGGDNE